MELKRFRDYYITNDGRMFQMVKDDLYELDNSLTCEQCSLKKECAEMYKEMKEFPCRASGGYYKRTEIWDYINHKFYKEVKIVLEFEVKNKPVGLAPKQLYEFVRPEHYKMTINGQTIEVMDILKAILTPEELIGFNKGNIIKYILRERNKNGIADVKKCKQYAEFMLGDEE